MSTKRPSEKDLERELDEFRERFPQLQDDDIFILWFLRAFVTEEEHEAAGALCGGSKDKGVDAVLIDEAARIVFIIQGKFHKVVAMRTEHRTDVMTFAQLGTTIVGDGGSFTDFVKDMSPEVAHRLNNARKRIKSRNYSLQLFYVTTGKCSPALLEEAKRSVRSVDGEVTFQLFDGKQILLLLADYLDGVAPPVPSLDLEIESGQGVRSSGVLNRYDSKTDIESWVFSITDHCLARLFERAGTRLFARNIRGFLGNTHINSGMEATLSKEPEYFWYYNNGVTLICDDAKLESRRGQDILHVMNPQIINGQQTTRILSQMITRGPRASVLVRVIRVPRVGNGNPERFDTLVSQIVSATNWQNEILPSDLMSNDRRQIEIERQFRKLGYLYLRKRETKGEARRRTVSRHYTLIRKDEVAQALAACDLDPSIVREGKERLFEERWYATIFPTADPHYYLTRYWLMRQVSYCAWGYPERAYAKWLVLNFVWSKLQQLVRSRLNAETFERVCQRNDGDVLNPLLRAIGSAFVAALRLYRIKRGKGARALDVSTLFKRRRLHDEFAKFWRGSKNRSRGVFNRAWNRFGSALAEEVKE